MSEFSTSSKLRLANYITGPAIRQAISAFDLPPNTRGLDACCGLGQHSIWLAEALGEGSQIVGVDLSAENLEAAREAVSQSPMADRIELERHNLLELDFPNDSFDWAWCSDALYPVNDMESINGLAELARVVRPGGLIGAVFWSGQQLLAGHPALESRLSSAHVRRNPYLGDVEQQLHYMRAQGWMQEVGLRDISARTFVSDIQGPLSGDQREALGMCCTMLWGDLRSQLTPKDWTNYLFYVDPVSPSFIGDLPEYYGFITYTLFRGRVPER